MDRVPRAPVDLAASVVLETAELTGPDHSAPVTELTMSSTLRAAMETISLETSSEICSAEKEAPADVRDSVVDLVFAERQAELPDSTEVPVSAVLAAAPDFQTAAMT